MIPPRLRCPLLLAAMAAAWQPSKALAAEEDTQFWLVASATGDIADGTRLTLDASQRWREQARGDAQQTFRVTLERTAAEGLRLGGGAMILDAGGATELRPFQQAVYTTGRLELRTRIEERFFDGADRMELRLRQRIQISGKLGGGWRGSIGGEWLGLLQGRSRGQGASTEQWRALLGVSRQVAPKLDAGAAYWLILSPRGERRDRLSHVPMATVTWHF
ncbi:MAG: DUF2490 domain-containing protein [Porphyrobacter sp.]|nr:DUF2490 domain-containing protein [Porphyrobacter sp.]